MRVLILAAGAGSRMLTETPKVLIEVKGRSLLSRHRVNLERLGICPGLVRVVTGYRFKVVEDECSRLGFKCLRNPCWRFPGTLGSFLLLPPSEENLLVIHGDLICTGFLLERAMKHPGDVVVPIDIHLKRRTDPEAMKCEIRGERVVHLSKRLPRGRSAGESMGVFLVRRHRELYKAGQEIGYRPWASLDDAVNRAAGRMNVLHCETREPWEEIDTPEDLEWAKRKFHG